MLYQLKGNNVYGSYGPYIQRLSVCPLWNADVV